MKFLLFATPRSGSTYLYSLLSPFMIEKYKAIPVSEYFEFNDPVKRTVIEFDYVSTTDKNKLNDYNETLINKLKANEKFLFMKTFPHQLNASTFKYLNDGYYFICLKRRDKLEQILSYGLGNHTKTWSTHTTKEVELYISKITEHTLSRKIIINGLIELATYDFLLNNVKNKHAVIYYEDIININPKQLLNLLFPNDTLLINSLSFNPPVKQNIIPKLQFFSNQSEILNIYQNFKAESRIKNLNEFSRKHKL